MTSENQPGAKARIAPAGLAFLAITSVGWGFNWPITKYLIGFLPPLTLRGTTGVIGASLLAIIALIWGQSLRVPRALWPRLVVAAILNVGCWMVMMGFALLYLPASEATLVAYTMPVWASLLAWPVLGERPNLLRAVAGDGLFGPERHHARRRLCGEPVEIAGNPDGAGGALGFAVGTVLSKKWPLHLPPVSSAAWQIGVGCFPVAIVGFLFDHSNFAGLSGNGWLLFGYSTIVQFCVAYVAWFAALARLPASVAAIGTMAVPVIGVVASAVALHEPLGIGQIAALMFTLAGVALATQS